MQVGEADNPLGSLPNPFSSNIYTDAWEEAKGDVARINGRAFDALWRAFERVREAEGNRSILIEGPPGSGKTHLLGRLRQRLASEQPGSDHGASAVFVHIQLSTSPDALWQHLRRRLTDNLLTEVHGLTQLQRIFAHQLAKRGKTSADKLLERFPTLLRHLPEDAITKILEALQVPSEAATVIEHLVHRRLARDARAWLRGDYLPPTRREALGVAPEPANDDAEGEAREIVKALASLSPRTLPTILCFDQVEALERFRHDDEALFRFGQVVGALFNEGRNLLLISCIQSSFGPLLEKAADRADFDRIAEDQTTLDPLADREARELLLARMELVPELAALRQSRHENEPLWPLDERQLLSQDGAFNGWTPRRLLARASGWFDQAAGRATRPPVDLPAFLGQEFDRCAGRLDPTASGEVLGHGLPQVCALGTLGWRLERERPLRDVAFRMAREDRDERVDVAILDHASMQALWRPLKRLGERKDRTPLVLLREARKPLTAGAKAARAYLEKLEERGARVLWLEEEALAALEAARTLLASARAGDLAADGETVPPEDVANWLARQLGSRLAPIADLFDEFTGPTEPVHADVDRIKALVEERRVIDVAGIAQELAIDEAEVERLAMEHRAAFGLLQGPPIVFFAVRSTAGSLATDEELAS